MPTNQTQPLYGINTWGVQREPVARRKATRDTYNGGITNDLEVNFFEVYLHSRSLGLYRRDSYYARGAVVQLYIRGTCQAATLSVEDGKQS